MECCGAVGILLNLLLFAGKALAGFFSGSIAIVADAFNNLSDAGSSVITLVGFRMAGQKPDSHHPFGHGRIEYISGFLVSIVILIMAFELLKTSVEKILHPAEVEAGPLVLAVLVASILVKVYMALYNRMVGKKIDSAAMNATAKDSLSDTVATFVVLITTLLSEFAGIQIDGYCGVVVSGFIVIAGIKSLWEVLGRVMGQADQQSIIDDVLRTVEAYPEIAAVQNLMVHDYGFGYFVISLRIEGYRKDSEQLYNAIHEISCALYEQFHCDCFIQADYLIGDGALAAHLRKKVELALQRHLSLIHI